MIEQRLGAELMTTHMDPSKHPPWPCSPRTHLVNQFRPVLVKYHHQPFSSCHEPEENDWHRHQT